MSLNCTLVGTINHKPTANLVVCLLVDQSMGTQIKSEESSNRQQVHTTQQLPHKASLHKQITTNQLTNQLTNQPTN